MVSCGQVDVPQYWLCAGLAPPILRIPAANQLNQKILPAGALVQQKHCSHPQRHWHVPVLSLRVSVYSLAKQNVVLPFLSKFGRVLKTHRLFRHYLYLAVVPTVCAHVYTNWKFFGQAQHLWSVHAERLNRQ